MNSDTNYPHQNHYGYGHQCQHQRSLSDYCMMIQNAAFLNREGAMLLAEGDVNTAIHRFMDALAYLYEAGGFVSVPSIGDAFLHRQFPLQRESMKASHPNAPSKIHLQRLTSQDNNDGTFFVYSSPLVFQPIQAYMPEYAMNCTATVLLNLSCAFHLKGRLAESRALYRAKALYEMTLSVIEHLSCQSSCLNLKVAATNNKAHVELEVSDVGGSKKSLLDLVQILSANHQSKVPPPFGDTEIEKFYMNILSLNSVQMAGAA